MPNLQQYLEKVRTMPSQWTTRQIPHPRTFLTTISTTFPLKNSLDLVRGYSSTPLAQHAPTPLHRKNNPTLSCLRDETYPAFLLPRERHPHTRIVTPRFTLDSLLSDAHFLQYSACWLSHWIYDSLQQDFCTQLGDTKSYATTPCIQQHSHNCNLFHPLLNWSHLVFQ